MTTSLTQVLARLSPPRSPVSLALQWCADGIEAPDDPGAAATEARPQYRPQGRIREIFASTDPELLVEGPAGTGKTRGNLERWHQLALAHPGARGIIVRKTLTSLTGSGLETYRRDVLPGSGVTFFGGSRDKPPRYIYPNGSALFLGSFHTAEAVEKVKSTDYDWAYELEATELTEEDHETLTTRMRTGVLPFQQVVADCNPGPQFHWLNVRATAGRMRRIRTRHQDNPRYWDEAAGAWTPEGESYVLGTLSRLTGYRRDRLFAGKWSSVEGAVYGDDWDAAENVVDEEQLIIWGIIAGSMDAEGLYTLGPAVRTAWMSQDWGYVNAGVLQLWVEDGDGRLYRLHEVYRTEQLVDPWWVGQAQRLVRHYRVRRCYCDPSEPGHIESYRRKQIPAEPAVNDVLPGIQAVQRKLGAAGDGRRGLVVLRSRPEDGDPKLQGLAKPTMLEQEIEAYAWDTSRGQRRGEQPVKEDDHACLVADTMISTMLGPLPIHAVRTGDFVDTRYGLRRVKWAGQTSPEAEIWEVTTGAGVLRGTGNHPVLLADGKWLRMDALRYGMMVICGKRPSDSTESISIVTQTPRIGPIARTSRLMGSIASKGLDAFTRKSGRQQTDRSQPVAISTTWISRAIRSMRPISSALHRMSTAPSTARLLRASGDCDTWTTSVRSAQHGTDHQRVELGTLSTGACPGSESPHRRELASNAGQNIRRETSGGMNASAQTTAKLPTAGQAQLTTKTAHALDAGLPFESTSTPAGGFVAVPVRAVRRESRPQPVYNLLVSGAHEYIANGIVVHNCDALRYFVASRRPVGTPSRPKNRHPRDSAYGRTRTAALAGRR